MRSNNAFEFTGVSRVGLSLSFLARKFKAGVGPRTGGIEMTYWRMQLHPGDPENAAAASTTFMVGKLP